MAWSDMTELTRLIGWYKPSGLSGYADTDPIDSWAAAGGITGTLVGTTTTRPLKRDAGINGLAAADFDGTDDTLAGPLFTLLSTDNIAFCVAMYVDVHKNYGSFVNIDDNAAIVWAAEYLITVSYVGGQFLIGSEHAGFKYEQTDLVTGPVIPATTDCLLTVRVGDSGTLRRVTGEPTQLQTFSGSGPHSNSSGDAYLHLGWSGLAGSALNGRIAEVVIWDSTADNEEIWIEGYLADKYGLTLPAGHLFKEAPPDSAPATYNAAGGVLRRANFGGGFQE